MKPEWETDGCLQLKLLPSGAFILMPVSTTYSGRRANKELRQLMKDPIEGVECWLTDQAPTQYFWSLKFSLPDGEEFLAKLEFPDRYPMVPPILHVPRGTWHPNVVPGETVFMYTAPPPSEWDMRAVLERLRNWIYAPNLELIADTDAAQVIRC